MLAVVMALAGIPVLFATLGSLVRPGILNSLAMHNSSPMLLVAMGAILVIADRYPVQAEPARNSRQQGSQREL